MKIDVYSQNGEKNGQISLNPRIFDVKINHQTIHRALMMQLNNTRKPVAHTKTKGLVRGGGRKPWRQKGTGRARQGSRRAPHWRGGGVIFGPDNTRNFVVKMPTQEKRMALFSILSAKAKETQIIALESFQTEKPKTKTLNQLLKKLPIERNVLIVLPEKNKTLQLSAKNLSFAKAILVNYLNPHDLLTYRKILFLKEALEKLEKLFLKKEKNSKPKLLPN